MSEAQPAPGTWRSQPRLIRELAILVGSLAFGVLLMPLAVYAAGEYALGAYHNGQLSDFYLDFLRGLAEGARAFWAVALGPYLFVQLLRLGVAAARRRRAADQVEV